MLDSGREELLSCGQRSPLLSNKVPLFCCVIRAGRGRRGWGGVAVKDGPFKENQEELVDVREQRQLQVPVPCPTFLHVTD